MAGILAADGPGTVVAGGVRSQPANGTASASMKRKSGDFVRFICRPRFDHDVSAPTVLLAKNRLVAESF